MKTILLLVTALAAFCGAEPRNPWNYLTVNFQQYYKVPTTMAKMKSGEFPDYVLMAHDKDLNVDLYSWPKDPQVSVLFDTHGNIGGVRVSWIKEDLPKLAESKGMKYNYRFADQGGLYDEETYWGIPVWYSTVLFADPDTLRAGGREKITEVFAEHVYLKIDGKWTELPRDQCEFESKLEFYQQQCIEHMGLHYMHKSNETLDLAFYTGLNAMFHYGELVAVNFAPFGYHTRLDRDWMEEYNSKGVKHTSPHTPDHLKEWVDDYGLAAIHVSFTDPRTYTCNDESQVPDRCSKQAGKPTRT